MRITEALKIIQSVSPDAVPYQAMLASGFAPLHLKTFLHAHLQQTLPRRSVSVAEGLFGDLPGTLERAAHTPLQVLAIALEWSDLDSRLGYRSTARWSLAGPADILRVVERTLDRMRLAIGAVAPEVRIAISLPGLPLPPVFHTAGWQSSQAEIQMQLLLSSFCAAVSGREGLAFVNPRQLAGAPADIEHFDFKSELLFGFPYTLQHADRIAESLARLLAPPAPMKGIVTDLDNTLWHGIAGEVGSEGVSWDLSRHHHLHALYQNLLSSLAEQGILVAVASKNDRSIVDQCFARSDILLPPDRVFPFEVHWQAKSHSVGRILQQWNIAADSVIFVDDSPMELAEVEAAHPGIRCIRFPTGDYPAGFRMLREISDLCAKERISQEDLFRADSIRRSAEFQRGVREDEAPEQFLEQAGAGIVFDFASGSGDQRALELVNKTNQFNLNGIRRTEADWRGELQGPDNFMVVVTYEDKFGPLGKIAVIQGSRRADELLLGTWVMSCRAFSRRIEHQCLRLLFERFDVSRIFFDFVSTPRNGPLQEFLESLLGRKPEGKICLTRQDFGQRCPPLFHRVIEKTGIEEAGIDWITTQPD